MRALRERACTALASTALAAAAIGWAGLAAGCGSSPPGPAADRAGAAGRGAAAPTAVVLITVDTLRADRVGAYGWRAARTPAIDALAARGVRLDRAFAPAPITLPSHASLLTGLNPPRHGARHNGMRLAAGVPTLAERLRAHGFATGAFIAAFPLDRRFGLDRGFDIYGDTLPRGADGKPRNERPGSAVVDEALAWIAKREAGQRFFLWVHLFEPHAPYEDGAEAGPAGTGAAANGAAATGAGAQARPPGGTSGATARSVSDRYDAEVARADAQIARLVTALQMRAASTLFIVTADHGEAFGEHGEIGHSLFVYDTTLRVPLVLAGPGIPAAPPASAAGGQGGANGQGRVIQEAVSLVDITPTVLDLLGLPLSDDGGRRSASDHGGGGDGVAAARAGEGKARPPSADAAAAFDGVSLAPLLTNGAAPAARALYAESFAPLLDFGWSPLRALRRGDEKYIAAPKPELYDVTRDPAESRNLLAERAAAADALASRIEEISPADIRPPQAAATAASSVARDGSAPDSGASGSAAAQTAADREAEARLRSLGYLASSPSASSGAPAKPDAQASPRAPSRAEPSPAAPAAVAAASRAVSSRAALAARVDPKDRVAFAARIAEVTSGELQGAALRRALEQLVKEDPRNGQMQMRLGVVLQEAGDCRAAAPHYRAAIAASVPSADPHLGLAECLAASGDGEAARRALVEADRIEPGNPIVSANLGMMALQAGRTPEAIARLRAALDRAPDLHPVRFALARAYGRAGQRADAAREARELLTRLPADAPQRGEVERLLAVVQ